MSRKEVLRGAICSVTFGKLHPTPIVHEKFPNAPKNERLTGLICQGLEMRRVRGKMQLCAIFRHEDFAALLHAVLRWVKVVQHGPPIQNNAASTYNDEEVGRELPAGRIHSTREDINRLRAEGFDVDDDNDPAPENIPDQYSTNSRGLSLNEGQQWKKEGICRRKMCGFFQLKPTVNTPHLDSVDLLSLFKLLAPFAFVLLYFSEW